MGKGKKCYWQACIDNGHSYSWVWRESPDVASNHDMCYASSATEVYPGKNQLVKNKLPVTASSASRIPIPQNSELINQTSGCNEEVIHITIIADRIRHSGIDHLQKE
jgi:hypothetical protein